MDHNPRSLREKAAEYRRRAEDASDADVQDSLLFLATVLEEQAEIEERKDQR